MSNLFQTKNISFEIKDLDTVGRRVKFAAAAFGNVDSDNDTISYGAFNKSISERGPESQSNRKIKFLRYHDFIHCNSLANTLYPWQERILNHWCAGDFHSRERLSRRPSDSATLILAFVKSLWLTQNKPAIFLTFSSSTTDK